MVRQLPGTRQPLHRHPGWRLVLFLAGEMEEADFGTRALFSRGTFVVRPSFYAHSNSTPKGTGASYVRFGLSPAAARRHFASYGWRARRGRIDVASIDIGRRAAAATGGDDLLDLARHDAYLSPPPASPLSRLASLLEAGPHCLAQAAEELGLRPYQLTRRYVRAFGVSPSKYAREARLQRALAMLAEGSDTLAGIAAAAGFHDQSHLNREIKRETGLTPRGFAAAFA